MFLWRFWLKVRILARNTQLPGVQRVLERRPAAACFGPKRALRAKIAVGTQYIERQTKQISHFTLKGTQTWRWATRVRNKWPGARKHAPGLKSGGVSLANGSEGGNWPFAKITRPTFSCSTPTFFFGVSGPAQKAVLVPFFLGGFYDLFFFQLFFLISGGFQWGCFRS